ncbi:protein of unknown function [Peptostreptococcus russellii]|uniref:DUF4298 domain-containing protein n=1 Tax=Peptostreptococcus russellii TaxID=215200 RepID=A0A1H8IT83_9FIRM|nr:DUF4298 domain-containing protein [Peptostreptococcus russellii]SEN71355.1 protein of unknown function [Peptostreptococcus russellii]
MKIRNEKYEEQLARVIHMEEICDRVIEALLSKEDVYKNLKILKSQIQELKAYYEGPDWLEDFDADRRELFPKDLKRGILAEDTLYNLLYDVDKVLRIKGK